MLRHILRSRLAFAQAYSLGAVDSEVNALYNLSYRFDQHSHCLSASSYARCFCSTAPSNAGSPPPVVIKLKTIENAFETVQKKAKELAGVLKDMEQLPPDDPSMQLLPSRPQRHKALLQELDHLFKNKERVYEERDRAAVADEGKLYSNVSLFLLAPNQQGYGRLLMQKTTKKKVEKLWRELGFFLAVTVTSPPQELLTLGNCKNCVTIDDLQLADDMQLAAVFGHWDPLLAGQNSEVIKQLYGVKNSIVARKESKAAAYALKLIEHEPDAQVLCETVIGSGETVVQLDGAATSRFSASIGEHTTGHFSYQEVLDFVLEMHRVRFLTRYKDDNTEHFEGKRMLYFMIAGSWNTDEQASIQDLMEECGILALTPHGDGYNVVWGGDHRKNEVEVQNQEKSCH